MGNNKLDMGKEINTAVTGHSLYTVLFGKTRRSVLTLVYGQPDTLFYTRQVVDTVRTGRGAVQRELKNLTDAGIITREVQGRQVCYRANRNNPVFNELKSIFTKIDQGIKDADQPAESFINSRFRISDRRLKDFCCRNHIQKLSLFGSVLRKDFHAESDIDVLVEFEAGHVPGFGIINIEKELSQIMGRKVDLRTPGDLSRYFRSDVIKEARVKYEYAGS